MTYFDPDRIDIVARNRFSGLKLYVQTDHRTAAEMEASRDLSTVVALMRVLNPMRTGRSEGGRFKVVFASSQAVPDFIHQAVSAAGGAMEIGRREKKYRGEIPPVEALLNPSLANIAAGVSVRLNLPFTFEGISALERNIGQMRIDKTQDHVLYWTSVIEMGAFAGEVMRRQRGGGWTATNEFISTLPVVYVCWTQTINFFGKAMKYLENGETDSVAYMTNVACQQLDREGHTTLAPAPSGAVKPVEKPGPFGRLFGK